MLFAYSTGLMLSFSLILAIGSQNAFVLRQGILRQHVWPIVLFCAVADTFLIITGVFGLSLLIADFVDQISRWLFGGAAVWLFGYGLLRIRDLFDNKVLKIDAHPASGLWTSLGAAAALTFAAGAPRPCGTGVSPQRWPLGRCRRIHRLRRSKRGTACAAVRSAAGQRFRCSQ